MTLRGIAILLAALCSLSAAEFRIDHVTVAGTHVESMRHAFTAVTGVPTEYGGKHANHATEMALVSFPDGSYIELMGVQTGAQSDALQAQPWRKFLIGSAGPCAFAARVPDVSAEAVRLRSAGVTVATPERSGRTRPDGTRLEWETATAGEGLRGTQLPFLIRDFTPRENRVYPSGKPTTDRFRGVAKVVIGVRDLDRAVGLYRRAFGLPAPRRDRDTAFGASLAWFEGTPIVLAKGLDEDSWLSRRVRDYGDAPCAFVLAGKSGLEGARGSSWFGATVSWADESKLGWRLGVEIR